MRLPGRAHALSLTVLFGFAILTAQAPPAHAVPPVPDKKGPAPREGFSRTRFQPAPPGAPAGAARAPLRPGQIHNVLAIRAAFSDVPIDSSDAYYDRLLLFMKQYWEQVTEGIVTVNPTLHDSVFTLSLPMAYYGDDDRFQERLVFLVRDVVQLADSTVDFRPYDSIVIFHAGQGQEADVLNDSKDQIWSAFVTPDDFRDVLQPDSLGRVGVRTNDLISPGNYRYITEAVEVPESESQDGYSFGMVGVLCHEFGHQIGLPDLYDTNGDEEGESQGVGPWDVMGTGVWNANGRVPAEISAWSKIFLGVIAPQVAATNGSRSLSMLERQVDVHPRAIQIPMTQSEYLLLENRRQDLDDDGRFDFDDQDGDSTFDFYADSYAGAEFDFFLPGDGAGSGMLIYHVDDSVVDARLADNTVNSAAARKGVDLVEADGIEDLDGPPTSFSGTADDVFRAGWRDRLTPDTTPSSDAYGGVRSGIHVTGITAPDSVMTFQLAIERSKPGWPKLITGRIGSAPALAANLDPVATIPPGSAELLVPVQRLNNTGALYVFRGDGNDYLDGDATPTPFATANSGLVTSPCVGDIDGAPGLEIVFLTLNGTLYAFHANGTEVLDGDANPMTLGVLIAGAAPGVRAQPVLAELDGNPGMEIVVGTPSNALGFSLIRVVTIAGGTVQVHTLPVGGSSESPPVIADVNGDGIDEIFASVRVTTGGDYSLPGLYYLSWEALTDPVLPRDPENLAAFRIAPGLFTAPVAVDLDRGGGFEIVVADDQALFHAFRVGIAPHITGDFPSSYVTVSELAGWPSRFPGAARGRLGEISAADLEGDGHPEVFQTGDEVRVAALHWTGSPRSGYPLRLAAPFAPADSAGVWAPLLADVDADGIKDVIPILPDGRRPAHRADGSPIEGFVELGSTGLGAPPILADVEDDGVAEWIETIDGEGSVEVDVRTAILPVPAASVAWGQYRLAPSRNAVVPSGPAGPAGTSVLSEVYAYPNPSRGGESRIHYRLASDASSVSVRVYDASGTLVADLATGPADRLGASEHALVWSNRSVASGLYVCRVEIQSSAGAETRFTTLAVIR